MKVIKCLLKVFVAGIVSILIISGLLFFYDILPVHKANKKQFTDYVWPANSFWVKATEGISFGRFDANGFNNKSVVDNPDIIIAGSSHVEAINVMPNESVSYLLSEKFSGDYSVYNIGVSGHSLFKVCQYLPNIINQTMTTPKVVIIETSSVDISKESVDSVISSTVEYTPSHDRGIIGLLQRVPFFRTLYHQVTGGLLKLFMPSLSDSTSVENSSLDSETFIDDAAYIRFFEYLNDIESKTGTQIIIIYHPKEKLLEDGNIGFTNTKHLVAFGRYAREYRINFVDLTKRFEHMYYYENHVAHGFCTGLIASGHLNKYGHAAAANELEKEIRKLEEAGEICK